MTELNCSSEDELISRIRAEIRADIETEVRRQLRDEVRSEVLAEVGMAIRATAFQST